MTQGESLYDAICMGRDCLGAYSLDQKPPMPSSLDEAIRIAKEKADDDDFIWSCGTPFYVDIDTEEYRKRITPSVTKTCTIPSWLNDQAEAAGIDFSSVLFCRKR